MNPFSKKNQDALEKLKRIEEAVFTDEMLAEIADKPVRTFASKFIVDGFCGYDNELTLVRESALEKMAPTFINRAVIKSPHDLNIYQDNIMKKASGRVIDVWKEETANAWWAKFEIWDEDLLKAIDNDGYNFVSCAYFITDNGGPGVFNAVEYSDEVLDGFYHHLAVTNNPRYDDSDIYRINENKNDLNFMKIGDIMKLNEIENSDKGENKMFGKKKIEAEVDKDVMFETSCGELTIEQMVAKINDLEEQVKTIQAESAEKDKIIAEKDEALKNAETKPAKPKAEEKPAEPIEEGDDSAKKVGEGAEALKEAAAKALDPSEAEKEALAKTNDKQKENVACVKVRKIKQ